MKQTHTRREKGRAVFLVALMVLSVFAMTVSFAGAAAAAPTGNATVHTVVAANAPVGQSAVTQDVTITTSLDDDDEDVLTIDTSDLPEGASVTDVGDTTDSTNIAIDDTNVDGDEVTVDISNTADSTDASEEDIIVTLTLDVQDADEDSAISYTVSNGDDSSDASDDFDLEAPVGSITGSVTDGDDSAIVTAIDADGNEFTATTASGDYTIDELRDGDYKVYVEGSAPQFVTVSADANTVDFDGEQGSIDEITVFQGSEVTATVPAGSSVELLSGDESDNSFVRQLVNDNGEVSINTDNLDGDYILRIDGDVSAAHQFEVAEQTLDAEWDAESVVEGKDADLELDSNRNGYTVHLTSDELDADEIVTLFGEGKVVENDDGDEVAQIENVSSDETLTATFADDVVNPGDYTITISAIDTTAEADATISVKEEGDANAQFDQSSYSEEAGDIVEFTVEMENVDSDSVQVDLSEKNDNYDVTLDVTDEDGDGEVTVYFNTYLAGEDNNAAFYTHEDSNDTVEIALDENDDELLNDQTGDARLLPADFTLELFTVDEAGDREKVDAAFLRLNAGSIDDLSSGTAPNDADLEDVDDILENSKKSDEIAEGDRVLFAVEASGVFGAIDVEQFEDHFDFVLEQTNNQYDGGESLTESQYEIVEDAENDRFFVVLDMSEVDMESGDEFELRLEPNTDDDGNIDSLYFIDDEEYKKGSGVIVSDQFSIVERTVEVTGDFDKEDRLMVPNGEEATITGHSNAAPGSNIHVSVDGDTTYQGQTVQVQKGGTVEATFDLSDFDVGQEFTITMTDSNGAEEVNDEVDAILVKGDKTDDEKDGDEKKDDEKDGDEKDGDEKDGDENNNDNDNDQNDDNNDDDEDPGAPADEQPGFGIAVALIALLAAAGFALRRQ